jgi:hypothetical protein
LAQEILTKKGGKLKTNRSIRIVTIMAAVSFFFVAAIYAGTKVADVIELKAPYEKTRSSVTFTHKKHVEDYNIGCGECHHDDKGQPLTDLKEDDDVQRCVDCHSKPGELKGKKAEGLSTAEKLEYHANAMHENCSGCHRQYNRENKTTAAPVKCTDCHPK